MSDHVRSRPIFGHEVYSSDIRTIIDQIPTTML